MLKGIFNTLSGKLLSERRIDTISNNISNALTSGYKASRFMVNTEKNDRVFESIEQMQSAEANTNIVETYIDFSNAPMIESGNKLDLGIEGDGFFVVSTPDGNIYTRNGQFTVSKENKLVNFAGMPVVGQGGDITINGTDIRIEGDGSIFVDKAYIDKLKIADFKDKKSLRNYGNSMFVNIDNNNPEVTAESYSVKQGFYEASNVNVMREMIEMMNTVRAYETYTKAEQYFGDMMTKLINVGRG